MKVVDKFQSLKLTRPCFFSSEKGHRLHLPPARCRF